MTKLIFGCGYLGSEVARQWVADGDTVLALTRSSERAKALSEKGLRPFIGDITESFQIPEVKTVQTALFAVGFDRSSGKSIQEVYVEGLRHVLSVLPDTIDTFVYISSTGVYGQSSGEWVDEDSECRPERPGGQACLAAEQYLAKYPVARRQIVLRLAGIYGPGRIPRMKDVVDGRILKANPAAALNLIHRDDAVQVIRSVERQESAGGTFNVSDGNPVRRDRFYAELATLLAAPPPRFESNAAANPTAAERDRSSKRVSNRRLRDELRINFRYPSYREGLQSVLPRADRVAIEPACGG